MSRNGSGTYTLPAGQPVVTGTVIDSTVFNTFTNDVAQALTASIAKDGQTTPSANLPMGGFKHTGVADAALRTQYASAGQVQDGTMQLVNTVAGTDTITGSLSPAITVYAAGMRLAFVPAGANTGAATINLNALGAKSIVKGSGTALAAGDILSGKIATILYDGTSFVLVNPQTNIPGTQILAFDGTVAAPSYSFVSDPDTGIYHSSANSLAFSAGGAQTLTINPAAVIAGSGASFYAQDGAQAGPQSYTFINDQDTGIYRTGANSIGIAAGGVQSLGIDTTSVGPSVPVRAADGTAGAPSYSFNLDTDTGIYRAGANSLAISVGGAQTLTVNSNAIIAGTGANFFAQDGSQAGPAYNFLNDQNTGIYRVAASSVGVTTNGTIKLRVNTAAVSTFLPLDAQAQVQSADGAVGAPGYSFSGDTNTGIYRVTSDDMAIAAGGADVVRFASNAGATPQMRAVDGVVGNPVYSFDSDPDTGFYRDTNNQIGIALGGVTAGQIAQGSFTGTLTGFTANPTGTVNYRVVGRMAIVHIPSNITATSNSISMTLTGAPSIIIPAAICTGMCLSAMDNGLQVIATFNIFNSGVFAFSAVNSGVVTGFTSSGTKGLVSGLTMVYDLG